MSAKINGLSGSTLKIIAIILMVIDHIGAILFPNLIVLRIIGRSAFPIFCFLLVEGLMHTHNKWHYALRLGIFALISQVPFSLALADTPIYLEHLNVFFTLFIGLLMLIGFEYSKEQSLSCIVIFICAIFVADTLRTDYGAMGIMIILIFYFYNKQKNFLGLAIALFIVNSLSPSTQIFSVFSLIPIYFYNGKRGISLKYVFYIFYPVHLLILYFIGHYLDK